MNGFSGLPLRDDLVGEEPYGAPQIDVPVVFNVNKNPYPPSGELRQAMGEAIQEAAAAMNRYPDREVVALHEGLASYLGNGLTARNIWVGNGSNEIMGQLLTAFGGPGRRMLTFTPTYSMCPEYARNICIACVTEPRNPDLTVDAGLVLSAVEHHASTVVVITTPNNPTGTCTAPEVIDEICSATGAIVVVDEAYQKFSRYPGALPLLTRYPRLVITRTMSKASAMAGGRVGYLVATPEIVDACRIVRLPYHMSLQTQALARVALAHRDELLARVEELAEECRAFQGWLQGHGYEVVPSEASFVLFGRFKDRHSVWRGLLDRGVLICEIGPERFLRTSTGTPRGMAVLKWALAEINSEGCHP